jgi:hypothetical protein
MLMWSLWEKNLLLNFPLEVFILPVEIYNDQDVTWCMVSPISHHLRKVTSLYEILVVVCLFIFLNIYLELPSCGVWCQENPFEHNRLSWKVIVSRSYSHIDRSLHCTLEGPFQFRALSLKVKYVVIYVLQERRREEIVLFWLIHILKYIF